MSIDLARKIQSTTTLAFAITMMVVSTSPGYAASKKQKSASADSTYTIREKCIAKAQAAYPDNGMGQTSVMTQRTGIYADCARSHGIRP